MTRSFSSLFSRLPLWGLGLFASCFVFFGLSTSVFAATGDVLNIDLLDSNDNGKINQIAISIDNPDNETWAENGVVAAPGFSVTFDGAAVSVMGTSTNNNAANPVVWVLLLDETDVDLEVDTSSTNVEVTYTQAGGDNLCALCLHGDTVELNTIAVGDLDATNTENDAANPVVVSVSPEDDATGVSRTSPELVITFSEAMDDTDFEEAAEFSISPDDTSWTEAWDVTDTIVTLTGAGNYSCGGRTKTVTLESDNVISNLAENMEADYEWSFTTRACSNGGSSEPVVATYGLNVTSPTGGSFVPGTTTQIVWDDTSTSPGSFASLWAVTDGVSTPIAQNISNGGIYNWTIPASLAGKTVKVRVEATDLATVLVSAESANFSVSQAVIAPAPTTPAPTTPAPTTVTFPSGIMAGDFVRSASFPTVYYVDTNGTRRPFYNSMLFYTWANDFSVVKLVSDETLRALPLGFPMLPKVGVVLVKVESVPHVYALSMINGVVTLRWIPTEALAAQLFGSNWSDYVIDVPVTLFSRFGMGSDVDQSFAVDRQMMHTRSWLGSR